MKKVLLSFAIIALATFGASAQVQFGLKAGTNISTFTGDDADNVKSLVGANGGVFATIPISTMFSLQPELLYSLEGAKDDGSDDKLTLGYINIPLMLKYNNPSGFYGELGPQLGILASAKSKTGSETEDVKDSFKSTNFSLGFGAGYNFSPNIGVGVRYNLGLSNIIDVDGGDLKTSNISIGLHYTFGGGTTKE